MGIECCLSSWRFVVKNQRTIQLGLSDLSITCGQRDCAVAAANDDRTTRCLFDLTALARRTSALRTMYEAAAVKSVVHSTTESSCAKTETLALQRRMSSWVLCR
jgi:hypothetical protein